MITTGQIFWKDFAYATDKCSGITLNVHLVFLGEHLWFPVKKFTVLSIPGKLKTIWTMTIWLRFACSSLFFSPGLLKCFWNSEEWGGLEINRWRFLSLIRLGPHLSWGTWLPPSPTSGIGRHLLSSTSSPAFQAFSSSLVSFWCWLFFAPYDLRRVHLFLQLDQWHKRAQCRYATEGTNYPPGFVFNPLHTMQCVSLPVQLNYMLNYMLKLDTPASHYSPGASQSHFLWGCRVYFYSTAQWYFKPQRVWRPLNSRTCYWLTHWVNVWFWNIRQIIGWLSES